MATNSFGDDSCKKTCKHNNSFGDDNLSSDDNRRGGICPYHKNSRLNSRGATGATGATGPMGAQGMAATISIESAGAVPFDDNPSVVNVGTPHAAVLRFSIPAGKPGASGKQGEKGEKGEKGDTGNTGATGPKGATGATGPAEKKAFGQLTSHITNADLKNGVPVQIPLPYAGKYENVTPAIGTITIQQEGYYSLYYAFHPFLKLDVDYADLTFALRSNGVNIPYTARTIRSTKGTFELKFYGGTIAWLPAGAVIDSTLTLNDDGKFFFSLENISTFFLNKIA